MRQQSDSKMCSAYTPVYDAGPTLHQHWFTVLCMLGHLHSVICDTQCSAWIETGLVQMMLGKWKWNESGFRPPLCTYRLNWARRTSWGWWDDWDDTVLQTQDSKFEPWRSEAEHATSRSRRLPTILTFTRGWGRNNFVSFKPPRPGTEPRTLAWKAAVLTTTLGPPPMMLGRLQANYVSRPDKQHNIDYRCSADPMRFNVGLASATSDQYCISIGSTYRGCWVDLKPCGITILMVTE